MRWRTADPTLPPTPHTRARTQVSAVQKLARVVPLLPGLKLYRGLGGTVSLPRSFYRTDANGCRGFAEWGFMSTTSDRTVRRRRRTAMALAARAGARARERARLARLGEAGCGDPSEPGTAEGVRRASVCGGLAASKAGRALDGQAVGGPPPLLRVLRPPPHLSPFRVERR